MSESEFQLWNFELRPLLAATLTTSIILLSLGIYGLVDAENSTIWIPLLSLPHFICAMTMLAFCCASFHCLRTRIIQNYNILCLFVLALFYTNVEWFYVSRALRTNLVDNEVVPQIDRDVDFSGTWPKVTCNDTDPTRTWNQWPLIGTAVGCNNVLISGNIFIIFILIHLLPGVLKMRQRVAVAAACINTVFLVCGVLITGSRSWTLFTAAVFQLTAGFMAAHLCKVHELLDRKDFGVHRSVLTTTAKNQVLLDTFIPRNVLSRMASASENDFVHAEVPASTLLFCSLEPEQNIGDDLFSEEYFRFLKDIFLRFDDVVEQNNMFKYQHVGEWYIVACPRAARPFDADEQQREYPTEWLQNSLLLADAMQSITRRSKFRCRVPIKLKIGMSHGPIAGAVIGSHKAFYCLYGDTVNTAARMCKIAHPDSIRCSPAFARLVLNLGVSSITCESCGVSDVKGKGPMETFSISMRPASHFQLKCGSSKSGSSSTTRKNITRRPSFFDRLAGESTSIYSHSESDHSPHSATQLKYLLGPLFTFRESSVESKYINDQARFRRGEACLGLAVHLAALLMQFHAVAFPEYAYDYEALGDSALAAGQHKAVLILGCNMAASFAVTILVFLNVWMQSGNTAAVVTERRVSHSCFILRVSWIAVSVVAERSYGALGWTVIFATEAVICTKGLLGGASTFAECAARILVMAAAGTTCVFIFSEQPTSRTIEQINPLICITLISLALSAIFHKGQRSRWRRARMLHGELSRLQRILRDLIPAHIAKRMLEASAIPTLVPQGSSSISTCARQEIAVAVAGERCRAAVLQLDLCGFTRLSQTLPAVELARLVHRLFSRLDREVRVLRLFKMDTVGDAYIVAGFLPDPFTQATGTQPEGEENSHQHAVKARARTVRRTRKVCERLLVLAAAALEELSDIRGETDLEVRGRVGVAIGEVFVGALGRLQPRIHIRGMGMRAADILEQSGVENAVHASESFLRALRGGIGLGGPTGSDGTSGVLGSGCGSENWVAGPFDATPEPEHAYEDADADGDCRYASEEDDDEGDSDSQQKPNSSRVWSRVAHLWHKIVKTRLQPTQSMSHRQSGCPSTILKSNLSVGSLRLAVRSNNQHENVSAASGRGVPNVPPGPNATSTAKISDQSCLKLALEPALLPPQARPQTAVLTARRATDMEDEEWAPVGWSVVDVRRHTGTDPAVPSDATEAGVQTMSEAEMEDLPSGPDSLDVVKDQINKPPAVTKWRSYVLAPRACGRRRPGPEVSSAQ